MGFAGIELVGLIPHILFGSKSKASLFSLTADMLNITPTVPEGQMLQPKTRLCR